MNAQQPHLDRVADDAERWDCPSCDRVVEIVRRPGRPRLYCSHACRQRAYRWRRRHCVRTVATPAWPVESATAHSTQPFHGHALRSQRDPLAHRRDRHGREVTVCGLLARPHTLPRQRGERVPFLAGLPTVCRSCAGLVQPRPLGPVPPTAPSPPDITHSGATLAGIEALRAIDQAWPLSANIRALLDGPWR